MHFERAYCLYRCNRSKEALDVINELDKLNDEIRELQAQVLYRLDRFSEAFEIYRELSLKSDDDYKDERDTNLGASLTYSGSDLINNHINEIREDTYELCFNKACVIIALGQYAEAERKLRQCEKLCRDALEEDGLSEEEIQVELAHIKIQLGFIYHKQGRIREAHQLYTSNLKLKLEDIALAAVACNNAIIINKDQNVFDSKKKLKIATNEILKYKLTLRQRKFICLNKAMLNYYTNQFDACRKVCDTIESMWSDMNIYTSIIKAFILVKEGNYDEAMNILNHCQINNEEEKLHLQLVCVQLWLMQGNRLRACQILEDTGINRYRPGIVGALITLYSAEGKEDIAQKIYKETVEWYKVNKKTEGDLTNLWKQAAEFHLRNGQAQVAANSLEELLRESPNDKRALGQLIIAYAEFDKNKAMALATNLFSKDELYAGIDRDNVDSSTWLSTKKVPANNSPAVSSTPSSENVHVSKKKKHRKRKGKLPKNYDPKVAVDPERWLPKYERAGFRKKRDRRVKDVIKGSQGTASGQAELFDFSAKIATDSDQQDSPRVEPSP
ncbi:Anaphase-promoting complex subunit 3 protein, partial [Oryctes borbonicus]